MSAVQSKSIATPYLLIVIIITISLLQHVAAVAAVAAVVSVLQTQNLVKHHHQVWAGNLCPQAPVALWASRRTVPGGRGGQMMVISATATRQQVLASIRFRSAAIQIGSDSDWRLVGTKENHSMGLKTDGSLWAWEWNELGELGDGTMEDRYTPVQVKVE